MKQSKIAFYLLLLAMAAGLYSCYPGTNDLTYKDLDIALTMYDKEYYTPGGNNDFQNFETFTVPDTVIHLIGEDDKDDISRDYDVYMIQQVKANLEKLGYLEETDPENNPPDIVVTISVTTTDYVVYGWYPYWGWYWPYYKSTPAAEAVNYYYYPWYPWYGYGSTYTYSTGTVLLEMVDNDRFDPEEEKLPIIWAGLVNGLLGDSKQNTKNRISNGIDQCFNQSVYLFKEN